MRNLLAATALLFLGAAASANDMNAYNSLSPSQQRALDNNTSNYIDNHVRLFGSQMHRITINGKTYFTTAGSGATRGLSPKTVNSYTNKY